MTPNGSILDRRISVIIAAIVVFLATVVFYTNTNSTMVFIVLITDGLTAVGWIAGACALGMVILRWGKIESNPLLFLATAGGLGLGIFSVAALTLGLLGILNRTTAIAMPITGIILLIVDLLRHHSGQIDLSRIKRWLNEPAGINWLWLIPVISLATAAVAASVLPGVLWKPLDPHPYDVTSYHLQVPREWYEAGKIIPLNHNVFSYFPFNVEMQFLLAMHAMGGPWSAMYVCQFISLAYGVLMVAAIAGASPSKSVIGAAIASVVPWVIMLASVAYVESALMLYMTLTITWMMRYTEKPTDSAVRWRAILLAGVFAGFACGVKIIAVPMLLLAAPIAMIVVCPKPTTKPWAFRVCILFVIAGSLVLSPWLLRNIVWCGNPVFPVAMKTLGKDGFTDDQVERFTLAHSPQRPQKSFAARSEIVWNDVLANWQYGYVLLPAALLAAALRWRDRQTWMLLIVAAIIFIVWIGFTHLIPRFLVMLIPIAAMLIDRLRLHRAWPIGVGVTLLASIFGWSGVYGPLAAITSDPKKAGLVGVEDLSFMVPPDLLDMKLADKQVALVGDAGAFLYQIPMTRLHYRTVFNIPTNTDDPIEAWVGPQAKGSPNWLLVINPAEIDRLHQTYWKIPALPTQWEGHEQPFVLRGDHLKGK